jgi:hypothetical protein
MVKKLLLLGLLPLALTACGGDDGTAGRTTTMTGESTTTAPPPNSHTSFAVYYLRGSRVAPVRIMVARTAAVAQAALRALSSAPPQGYSSEIVGTEDLNVAIDDGVAKIDWDARTLAHVAAAQVVYTLTQFPTIRAVELPDGSRASRGDFEDVVPPILIETPLPHDTVESPIKVAGTASVFEATLVVELVQAGKVLEKKTVTAAEGAPGRGAFSTSFDTDARGAASIVAFSPSAADGSEQHRVAVPIEIS